MRERSRRCRSVGWLSLGALLALGGCAGASNQPPVPEAAADQPYTIGPGDHLAVFVYGDPQLSVADVPVQPDGHISLPLIQDLDASNETPPQLAHQIAARVSRYVKDPNVSVMVRQSVGPADRQIRVIGDAAYPQAIPYREHMTLLDVMIATRGLTRFAAGNRAVLVRRLPDGQDVRYHVHLADLIKDGDISANLTMQPGDTLIIPQAWF